MEYLRFTWIDYTLFIIMFVLSGIVGIYFGYFKKQSTTADYLLGGKKMKYFPVAMSLVSSTLSAITLLGIPSEIYLFGGNYMLMLLSICIAAVINDFIYLPVLYKLNLRSSYDYLEMRFDKKVKNVASVLFTMTVLLFLPVAIYAPSLAFNQVTGFNLHIIALVMSLFCIFYTTIGGIKAVVWTDTLQLSITLFTLTCVFSMGAVALGGLGPIWEKAKLGGRLDIFEMDVDPTVRNTFWAVVIGNICVWLSSTCSEPTAAQRFISVPTLRDARKCLLVYIILTIITKFIGGLAGFIMYAKYFDCDPLSAKYIQKVDQIVPYYVLDVAAAIPGLSGMFIAGLFSTTLSALSTFLNTLSGMIYMDFVAPFMPATTTERTSSNIMKLLTVLIGLLSISLVFLVEKLGSILELMLSLRAITTGPVLGLFTMGMLFPFSNKKGAIYGCIGSLLFISFIAVGNKFYILNGAIQYATKPLNTYGCNITIPTPQPILTSFLNHTTSMELSAECPIHEEPFWLFRISFHYYTMIGTIATLLIGLPISWATKNTKQTSSMNPELLVPWVRKYIPANDFGHDVTELEVLKDKCTI